MMVSCQEPVETARQEEARITLSSPSPTLVEAGSTWAELRWARVEGAFAYSIYFEGDEYPVMAIDTFAILSGLEPDTQYSISMTADPSSRSRYDKSPRSGSLSFSTTSKPSVDTARIYVSEVTTTSIALSWEIVEMAGSYEYSFAAKDSTAQVQELDPTATGLYFEGLVPGVTYRLMFRTIPSEEYSEGYVASRWTVLDIATAVPSRLAPPEVSVARASSIHTEISWKAVEDAQQYEYILDPAGPFDEDWEPSDGEKTTATDELRAIFEGLAKNSEHDFLIRACTADTLNHLDSRWTHISFTAVNDFVPTLRLGEPIRQHGKLSIGISAMAGEYYAAGIVPKAAFMDGAATDTTALILKVTRETGAAVDSLIAQGKTAAQAYSTVLFSSNSTIEAQVTYGTTYLCYAYGIDLEGDPTGGLKLQEARTDDYSSRITGAPDYVVVKMPDGSYSPENVPVTADAYWTLHGDYDTGVNYFKVSRPDASKTVTEVKYANLYFNDAFLSKYGRTAQEGAAKINDYFDGAGSLFSASGVSGINNGSTMASSSKGADGTAYVRAIRAVTAQGDTVIAAIGVQDPTATADWIHITGTSSGSFTVKCDLPVTEGRTYCAQLSSSNNRPELLPSYLQSVSPTAISAQRITALNEGTGYTAKYTLTSGKTYTYIIQLTNAAGDTVCRSVAVKIQ